MEDKKKYLLKKYYKSLPKDERKLFAQKIGVTQKYLIKLLGEFSLVGIGVAIRIDQKTNSAVRKEDLRPDIFGQ